MRKMLRAVTIISVSPKMNIIAANVAPTRNCTRCDRTGPIEAFPLRSKNSDRRHFWCCECFNAYRRQRRRMKRQSDVRGFANRLSHITRDEQAVVDLACRALKRFDGIPGLLAELKQLNDDARQAGDLRTAQQGLMAILNLSMAAGRLHER